jgi:integrase
MEAAWERAGNVISLDDASAREIALRWSGWIAAGATLTTGAIDGAKAAALFDVDNAPPGQAKAIFTRLVAHSKEALVLAGINLAPESRRLLIRTMLPEVHSAYLRADFAHTLTTTPAELRNHPISAIRSQLLDVLTTAAITASADHRPAVTLASIFKSWKAVTTVKPRVAGDTDGMLSKLERFLAHDDATQVTASDLRRWRDEGVAQKLNNNTLNQRLSMVSQVFAQAFKDGLLPSDPADNPTLRLKATPQEHPPPYEDEDAAKILRAARTETRASIRWAPWIMAFTGMRVAEVLQLFTTDIREDGGIHYISINEDDPGKSVKTANRRNVPIHPALIREGFLKYVATVPKG